MHTTSPSLLAQLRQPEKWAAWDRFVGLYTPLLYTWARSQHLDESDASDLVQEVFLILVKKLPEFEYVQGKSFLAWLRTILVNKHRELLRRRRPNLADNLNEIPATNDDPFEENQYRLCLVHQALRTLENQFPPSTWNLFWESVMLHRNPQELAKDRGISVGTIYAAKSKVLHQLRQLLANLSD